MTPIVHTIGNVDIEFPSEEVWQRRRFSRIHSEPDILKDMTQEITDGDVVFDIGANIGWHSIVAHESADGVSIVAFEPHPVTFDRLTAVVEWYEMDAKLYNYALFSETKEVEFSSSPGSFARIDPIEGEVMTIQAMTGDELLQRDGIPAPDVLKIDAEGAGFEVLRGFETMLTNDPPRIVYFEYHSKMEAFGADRTDLFEFLEGLGYESSVIDDDKEIVKSVR